MSFQESFFHSSAFSLNSVGWKWPAWITQGLRRCFKKCLIFWNLQWRHAIQTEKRTPGAALHARLPVVLSVSCGYVFQSRFRAGAAPAVWDLWDSGVQARSTLPLLCSSGGRAHLLYNHMYLYRSSGESRVHWGSLVISLAPVQWETLSQRSGDRVGHLVSMYKSASICTRVYTPHTYMPHLHTHTHIHTHIIYFKSWLLY